MIDAYRRKTFADGFKPLSFLRTAFPFPLNHRVVWIRAWPYFFNFFLVWTSVRKSRICCSKIILNFLLFLWWFTDSIKRSECTIHGAVCTRGRDQRLPFVFLFIFWFMFFYPKFVLSLIFSNLLNLIMRVIISSTWTPVGKELSIIIKEVLLSNEIFLFA